MLKKPYKPCSNCKRELVIDGSYCYNCIQIVEQERKNRYKRYNKEREDKEIVKFYNTSAWKKVRNLKRRQQPLCVMCLKEDRLTPSVICDHIIPYKVDKSLALSLDNLQMLCESCHNKKTADDKRKYG